MNSRLLILALPSAAILAALVWHSLGALPRRRAALFWISVVVFGVLRGLGVRMVTEAIGASFPYEIRNPTLSLGGVSAQEVAGWAVVAYLGWWVGYRFSLRAQRPYVFLQVAWASLFLGAISWTVEAAAIAARWWHWTVPTASRVFLNVPAIGIVDWFFVGLDFVLPFVALTAPALAHARWRYLTLLIFPAHFAGHLLPGIWLHVVHWILVLIAVLLTLRSDAEDRAFGDVRAWIPTAGFAVMVLDVALVEIFVVRRPELLQSVLPAIVIWLTALHPVSAMAVAASSLLAAFRLPSLLVATGVALGGLVLLWLRRRRLAIVAIVALAIFAATFHWKTFNERTDLTRRLDAAIAARDRGDIPYASMELEAIARDHPTSYVPLALGGEIDYRTEHPDAARAKLARAVEIKQDYLQGYRLLAVIELQRGNDDEGRRWAYRGLEIAPDDLQLRFLAGQNVMESIDSPATAAGLTALAFEAGDVAAARHIVREALRRWPSDPQLRGIDTRLGTHRN